METTSSNPPGLAGLVGIWQREMTGIADLCAPLAAGQWSALTPCPGWTVADVVAHLVDIEQLLAGSARPDHEPDWVTLPHAVGQVGHFTEIGVDARRGHAQADVVDELRAILPLRRTQLDGTLPGTLVPGPFGRDMPVEQLVRMRTFDAWVHEQDIRTAIGSNGGWDSDAAGIALAQIVGALPFVWARKAEAPVGSTLVVRIVGPGLQREVGATVDESGMGVPAPSRPEADVQLGIEWSALVGLACGRVAAGDPSLEGRVELTGDPVLGRALLAGLSITP